MYLDTGRLHTHAGLWIAIHRDGDSGRDRQHVAPHGMELCVGHFDQREPPFEK